MLGGIVDVVTLCWEKAFNAQERSAAHNGSLQRKPSNPRKAYASRPSTAGSARTCLLVVCGAKTGHFGCRGGGRVLDGGAYQCAVLDVISGTGNINTLFAAAARYQSPEYSQQQRYHHPSLFPAISVAITIPSDTHKAVQSARTSRNSPQLPFRRS